MLSHGSKNWVEAHRIRKLRFAGATANRTDERWNTRLLNWVPQHGKGRRVGRPHKKWKNDIIEFAGDAWVEHARDQDLWKTIEEGFAQRKSTL